MAGMNVIKDSLEVEVKVCEISLQEDDENEVYSPDPYAQRSVSAFHRPIYRRPGCNLLAQILAIRDVTSIANMLTVFAIFYILLYFSHSNSNFEA